MTGANDFAGSIPLLQKAIILIAAKSEYAKLK